MRIHIIQKGETMESVAAEYEVEQEGIIQNNPQIADPSFIVTGMKLRIPQPLKKVIHKEQVKTDKQKTTKNPAVKKKKPIHHRTKRPINEPLDDDGKQKPYYKPEIQMFHPAARPFTSLKGKGETKSKMNPSQKENESKDAAEPEIKTTDLFCDCCNRPMFVN